MERTQNVMGYRMRCTKLFKSIKLSMSQRGQNGFALETLGKFIQVTFEGAIKETDGAFLQS